MTSDHAKRNASAALERAEASDLAEELQTRERAARRHALWALLGLSPSGLVPLVAAASDFGAAALVIGVVCITAIESVRALRARADSSKIRAELDRLLASERETEHQAQDEPR